MPIEKPNQPAIPETLSQPDLGKKAYALISRVKSLIPQTHPELAQRLVDIYLSEYSYEPPEGACTLRFTGEDPFTKPIAYMRDGYQFNVYFRPRPDSVKLDVDKRTVNDEGYWSSREWISLRAYKEVRENEFSSGSIQYGVDNQGMSHDTNTLEAVNKTEVFINTNFTTQS